MIMSLSSSAAIWTEQDVPPGSRAHSSLWKTLAAAEAFRYDIAHMGRLGSSQDEPRIMLMIREGDM